MTPRDPYRPDPVREAVGRWIERFPEIRAALTHDPLSAWVLKSIEDMLVRADIVMQDEGLSHEQRCRVVTAALYGSVLAERAKEAEELRDKQIQSLKDAPVTLRFDPATFRLDPVREPTIPPYPNPRGDQ